MPRQGRYENPYDPDSLDHDGVARCRLLRGGGQAGGIISIDGSSTVFPITEAVAEEFQAANPARVTIGVSGTGGGFKKFCGGETMIVAIAAGQQPRLTLDPRVPIETMTAYIVQVSMGDTPTGTLEYRSIFVVGATLFPTPSGNASPAVSEIK